MRQARIIGRFVATLVSLGSYCVSASAYEFEKSIEADSLVHIAARNCNLQLLFTSEGGGQKPFRIPGRWFSDVEFWFGDSGTISLRKDPEALCRTSISVTRSKGESFQELLTRAAFQWGAGTKDSRELAIQTIGEAARYANVPSHKFAANLLLAQARLELGYLLESEQSLTIALESAESSDEQAIVQWIAGLIHRQAGKFALAEKTLAAALQHLPADGLEYVRQDIQVAICDAQVNQFKEEALACIDNLLSGVELLPEYKTKIYNARGGYYNERMMLPQALHSFEQAARVAGSGLLLADERMAANNVAHVLNRAGLPQQAQEILLETVRKLSDSPHTYQLAHAYQLLGRVALELGDRRRSEDYYRLALELETSAGYRDAMGWSMYGLGNVLRGQGRLREAVLHHENSKAVIDDLFPGNNRAGTLTRLALAEDYLGLHQLDLARRELAEVKAFSGLALQTAAEVALIESEVEFQDGDIVAATRLAEDAARKFEKLENSPRQVAALGQLARVLEMERPAKAVETGKLAIAKIGEVQKMLVSSADAVHFADLSNEIISEQVRRLMRDPGSLELAFALSESHRSGLFVEPEAASPDVLKQAKLIVQSLSEQLLLAIEKDNEDDARKLRSELEDARRRFGSTVKYRTMQPEAIDISRVRIPADTAFVSYRVDSVLSIAFVLDHKGLRKVDLGADNKIISELVGAGNLALARVGQDYREVLSDLSAAVWKPLAIDPSVDRVFVAPHGPIYHVPFAALTTSQYEYEPLFLEKDLYFSSTITSSFSEVDVPEEVFVMAPFTPDASLDSNWQTLRWSAREAESIRQAMPESHALVGESATFEALVERTASKDKKILHFSTHGFVSDQQTSVSGLVLAGASGRAEVFDWQLFERLPLSGDDIVVLNGCQTAAGEVLNGAGIVGLTQAFFTAGSKRVVNTQWRIDDRASALFSSYFYPALMSGNGVARAVGAAQQMIFRNPKYRHPYYWGGYRVFATH